MPHLPTRSASILCKLLTRVIGGGAVLVAAATSSAPAAAQQPSASQPCVGPLTARVCGTTVTTSYNGTSVSANAFMGIRYATAGRWQNPAIVGWTAQQATAPGSICPQGGWVKTGARDSTFQLHGAEDCLFLNVWRPSDATLTNLPVMVFIHGGAFVMGSGSSGLYNGAYLAGADSVVVVTLNYRLGALGFLAARNDSVSFDGNFGLLDQQTALQWVRSNIARFGGDPTRVTLFGESAGAMSVGFHLFAIPTSQTLFRAAIMESNPMAFPYPDTSLARQNGSTYLGALCTETSESAGCQHSATTLARVPLESVMKAQARFNGGAVGRLWSKGMSEGLPWTPVVDGSLVTAQPFNGYASGMPPKPLVFGTNLNEGAVFAAGAKGAAGAKLNYLDYPLLLNKIYGSANQQTITSYAANGANPYRAVNTLVNKNGLTAEQALNNLITDCIFACGNLYAGDSASTQSARAGSPPPVYAYRFEQRPFFTLYDTVTACRPSPTGNVCHGNELPYVFSSLQYVDSVTSAEGMSNADAKLAAGDWTLAQQMGRAWTNFAKGRAPLDAWSQYSPAATRNVYRFGGASNGQILTTLRTDDNCQQLWNLMPPVGGSVHEARSAARAGAPPPTASGTQRE